MDRWVRGQRGDGLSSLLFLQDGAADDSMAVVDPECRVRGLEGSALLIRRSSRLIPNGNLNAPTIMVAERASDLIRVRAPLREEAPVWQAH